VTPPEPVCAAGLHLAWSPAPGCTGHFWFRQRHWEDFMSGRVFPELAGRYDLALEPRRTRWNAYLQAHHLQPTALLADSVHPNPTGWTLMARLFTSWLEEVAATRHPVAPDPQQVRDQAPPAPGVEATYRFTGNRVELLADGPLAGHVEATVDGRARAAVDGCWQVSRVSPMPNAPEWPALRQVIVDPALHRPERWTVRLHGLDGPQAHFSFAVSDSRGPIGTGTSDADFTSARGEVRLLKGDWVVASAHALDGKSIPEGSSFTWDKHWACGDEPAALAAGGAAHRYVVATGLPNGEHLLKLRIGPGTPRVKAVRSFRPPLAG
jgi:hypothetical protein